MLAGKQRPDLLIVIIISSRGDVGFISRRDCRSGPYKKGTMQEMMSIVRTSNAVTRSFSFGSLPAAARLSRAT